MTIHNDNYTNLKKKFIIFFIKTFLFFIIDFKLVQLYIITENLYIFLLFLYISFYL